MIKKIIFTVVLFGLIFSPLFIISTPSLNMIQSFINSNKDKTWAPSWQLFMAKVFSKTFRPGEAEKAYYVFMAHYPKDPLYPEAKFYRANCIASDENRKDEAIKEFGEFIEWYPDHPLAPDAEKKKTNLMYGLF